MYLNSSQYTYTTVYLQGVICLSGKLDREQTQSYNLTVIATDNPVQKTEQKSNQTTITVIITDINDCKPEFVHKIYNISVREDMEVNSPVIQTSATDDDEPHTNNSKVVYEYISGNDDDLFTVDSETGQIRNKATLRGHVGNYTLTIMAKDHGNHQLNGTAVVNILVTDVNLNNPVLVGLPAGGTVKTYEVSKICTRQSQVASLNLSRSRIYIHRFY